MTRPKVKSKSYHDVAPPPPLTNVPTEYQLPRPYGCRDLARTRFYRSRLLWQGQRSNQSHTMTLHTYNPNQCAYHVTIYYTLRLPRYSLDKVKSRLYHDVVHLHCLTNVPSKYKLPTSYCFRDIAQTRCYRSRSLRQGHRSNKGHTISLHTYTP